MSAADPRLLAAVALALLGAVAGLALVAARGPGGAERDARPAAVEPVRDAAELRAAGRAALSLVGYRERHGYAIRFAPGRPGVRAEADRDRHTITVFLRRGDAPHRVAHDIAHELGHAVDDRVLGDAERRAFLRRRGAPAAPWWPGGSASDLRSGAGDFAEVFALCHAASAEFRSRLAPRPAAACAMLPASARTEGAT